MTSMVDGKCVTDVSTLVEVAKNAAAQAKVAIDARNARKASKRTMSSNKRGRHASSTSVEEKLNTHKNQTTNVKMVAEETEEEEDPSKIELPEGMRYYNGTHYRCIRFNWNVLRSMVLHRDPRIKHLRIEDLDNRKNVMASIYNNLKDTSVRSFADARSKIIGRLQDAATNSGLTLDAFVIKRLTPYHKKRKCVMTATKKLTTLQTQLGETGPNTVWNWDNATYIIAAQVDNLKCNTCGYVHRAPVKHFKNNFSCPKCSKVKRRLETMHRRVKRARKEIDTLAPTQPHTIRILPPLPPLTAPPSASSSAPPSAPPSVMTPTSSSTSVMLTPIPPTKTTAKHIISRTNGTANTKVVVCRYCATDAATKTGVGCPACFMNHI